MVEIRIKCWENKNFEDNKLNFDREIWKEFEERAMARHLFDRESIVCPSR